LCSQQYQVFPLDLPGKSFFIKELMDKQVFDQSIRQRGIRIAGFNILRVDLDDESKKKIDDYELTGDLSSQQARMVTAAQLAADNDAGAGVGFFNIGLMNGAVGGGLFGAAPQQAYPPPSAYPSPTAYPPPSANPPLSVYPPPAQPVTPTPFANRPEGAVCTNCGTALSGPFCAQCGTPAPPLAKQFCVQCGVEVNGPFCAQCGTKL
jgi:membrane protease subunit (stomatin/prohibitin family)